MSENDDDISELFEDEDKVEKIADTIENDTKDINSDFDKICEENTESITCSLGMTIPSNIQYENYKIMSSITIKKDKRVPINNIFKYAWKKVQEKIFTKYDEIMETLKDK